MNTDEIARNISTQLGGEVGCGIPVESWSWTSRFIDLVVNLLNLGDAIASGCIARGIFSTKIGWERLKDGIRRLR